MPDCETQLKQIKKQAKAKSRRMDGAAQIALPILGIAAVAAVTFYAVSFAELREKSFKQFEEEESENENGGGGFISSASSRERRARKKAEKDAKNK